MTTLRLTTLTLSASPLGPENPLPPMRPLPEPHPVAPVEGVPEEITKYMSYGRIGSPLPYTMQDGYGRTLVPRPFKVAVLENEILRATVLLEMGGRLWSLFHKPSQRELLHSKKSIQIGNLAIRNAWFAGGVEWNVGVYGHCPFTCSSLFAARVEGPNGTPILRLYEWERIREVPFQIDLYLPKGSPLLFARMRLVNPHDREVPMYWWTNIAVPESPDTRVIVPAERAFASGYGKSGLHAVPIPILEEMDISYTTNFRRAGDFFFDVSGTSRPWVTALDKKGRGLVQVSTSKLRGRKLFFWGIGKGGRRWQEFLGGPGSSYLEIQAGLTQTQMQHTPMPARTEWAWLEAFGLMEAHPKSVHSKDWNQARAIVERRLETLASEKKMLHEFERSRPYADKAPVEILHRGSGWGRLEIMRREAAGEPSFSGKGLVFDEESLSEEQAPWVTLLHSKEMPELPPARGITAYTVQPWWKAVLEEAIASGHSEHWTGHYHLGIMRYAAKDREGARSAWKASIESRKNPWALRNLAVLLREDKKDADAGELLAEAARLAPSLAPLAVECGNALLDGGKPQKWLDLLPVLSPEIRSSGRIRLLEARAALAVGDLDRVNSFLTGKVEIDDLREGEQSISNLWFSYQVERVSKKEGIPIDDSLRERVNKEFPVPPELDFRMSGD